MNNLPKKIIAKLRDKYELMDEDVDLFEEIVYNSPLGVKSTDIAVMCGRHPSDWDFVHELRKRAKIENKLETEVIRPKNTNYFLIVRKSNMAYIDYMRICRKKIKDFKVEEPYKVKIERRKRSEEKALEQQDKLAQKRKKNVNVFYEFRSSLNDRTQFTYRDVMVWSTFTRTYARKLVEKWIDMGFVRELERGTGGRVSKNVFIFTS